MTTAGLAARRAAWCALAEVDAGRQDRLGEALILDGLSPEDAGLAREIALGALRHAILYDALAQRFLERGRAKPDLRRILRLAAHQLFACDQIPPYAVGQTSVDLLRQEGCGHLTGVANAVIRRLAALRGEDRIETGPLGRLSPADRPTDLATRHGLPRPLVDDLMPLLDGEDAEARLSLLTTVPPLCTRLRPGPRVPPGRSVIRSEGDWWWWEDPQEALRGHVADGRCVVQDRAQARSIDLASPRPLERVLDLCAAPGGKALYLADLGCRVVASDLPGPRMVRLAALRDQGVAVLAQDGRQAALAEGAFDLVVVDAPCSNTGVLGRRPEALLRYDRQHLDQLVGLQRKLLRSATRLCAPDGRILYSTCSLSPRENQGIAHGLSGWRVWRQALHWPDGFEAGGYACVLVRI